MGNYLIGKSIGEGAFAKVKEGLHVITGEKVHLQLSNLLFPSASCVFLYLLALKMFDCNKIDLTRHIFIYG